MAGQARTAVERKVPQLRNCGCTGRRSERRRRRAIVSGGPIDRCFGTVSGKGHVSSPALRIRCSTHFVVGRQPGDSGVLEGTSAPRYRVPVPRRAGLASCAAMSSPPPRRPPAQVATRASRAPRSKRNHFVPTERAGRARIPALRKGYLNGRASCNLCALDKPWTQDGHRPQPASDAREGRAGLIPAGQLPHAALRVKRPSRAEPAVRWPRPSAAGKRAGAKPSDFSVVEPSIKINRDARSPRDAFRFEGPYAV
jgi:hypothetical protein